MGHIQLYFQNLLRANKNWTAGRSWPAGRSLDTPDLYDLIIFIVSIRLIIIADHCCCGMIL